MADELTAVSEEETPTVVFSENTDDTVTASFPSMNGTPSFEVRLKNMHWGLIEDIERMAGKSSTTDVLKFFEEYIVGGPRAVPFKHTMTVFNAIRGYIEYASSSAKND